MRLNFVFGYLGCSLDSRDVKRTLGFLLVLIRHNTQFLPTYVFKIINIPIVDLNKKIVYTMMIKILTYFECLSNATK